MPENEEPPQAEKPKRLSFREANLGPDPKPELPFKPQGFFSKRKRSVSIGLVTLGASAAALYGLTHRNSNCDQYPPDQTASCRQSAGGHGGGGGAHSFGSSSGSSSSESSSASRGGFGGTGSAHAGGGGE
jgi:hypothetical protein